MTALLWGGLGLAQEPPAETPTVELASFAPGGNSLFVDYRTGSPGWPRAAVGADGSLYVASTGDSYVPVPHGGGYISSIALLSRLREGGEELDNWVMLDDAKPTAVATGPDGAVYFAGELRQSDALEATEGALDEPGAKGFVMKLSADGEILFAAKLHGRPQTVAADAQGRIYLAGAAASDFEATAGAYQTATGAAVCVPYPDAEPEACDSGFAARLSADGSRLEWATFLGGGGDDWIARIAVDATAIHLAGQTVSADFPVTAGAFQSAYRGGKQVGFAELGDAFVAKMSLDGRELLYSTYLGGSSGEQVGGLAVDGSGAALVTGTTYSADFPATGGAPQTAYGDGDVGEGGAGEGGDAFYLLLDAGNEALVSSYRGGAAAESGRGAVALDDAEGGGFAVDVGRGPAFNPCSRNESILRLDRRGRPIEQFEMAAGLVSGDLIAASGSLVLAGQSVTGYRPNDFAVTPGAPQRQGDVWIARFRLEADERPLADCVVSAASFLAGRQYGYLSIAAVSPGEIVSIFGRNLGPAEGAVFQVGDDGLVPTELAGTTLSIGGTAAPLLYVGDGQVNAVVPFGVGAGERKRAAYDAGRRDAGVRRRGVR